MKLNPNRVFLPLEVVFGFFSTSLLVAEAQTVTANKCGALYDIQSLKQGGFLHTPSPNLHSAAQFFLYYDLWVLPVRPVDASH